MKVKFLYPRSIDGVNYQVGNQEVPDDLSSHWYFLALKANNEVILIGDDSDLNPHPIGTKAYHEYQAAWKSKKDLEQEESEKALQDLKDKGEQLPAHPTGVPGAKAPHVAKKVVGKKAFGKQLPQKIVPKEPAAAQE